MENVENKTVNVDLSVQSGTSLLIGYVLVLAAIFVAFEWTQREIKIDESNEPLFTYAQEEDMIPITKQEQPMAAPSPAAAPMTPEVLDVVDDNEEIVEEEIQTTEEVNQSIVAVVGTGAPTAVVSGPPAPVVEEVDDDRILDIPEENAEFPGDVNAWLTKNIKYPPVCQENNIQGRVSVQFVINKDGSIVDVKVLRTPDPDLGKEAERVVKSMPKWKPARQGNKTVRQRYVLPVMFRLS
ncbi:MAG: energy transducer TonB [Bacteroidaceae bacterium]|nr:energy transducer TonB [Bacteroidaceae bacterium]